MPKIKNILIFIAIAAVFVLIYIFFIKPKPATPSLVSSPSPSAATPPSSSAATTTATQESNSSATAEFLNLLLSVQSIKLDVSIFSESAFTSLHDSSIVLVPDGNEGRPNPFAPIGSDPAGTAPQTCTLPKVLNTSTNTCVNPNTN